METPTMGRVLATALIENIEDLLLDARKGRIPPDQVRRVEVQRRPRWTRRRGAYPCPNGSLSNWG